MPVTSVSRLFLSTFFHQHACVACGGEERLYRALPPAFGLSTQQAATFQPLYKHTALLLLNGSQGHAHFNHVH